MGIEMLNLTVATERLARLIAAKAGTTPEIVVHQAIEERARATGVALEAGAVRDLSPDAVAAREARIRRHADDIAALPLLDERSPRQIMDELNAL